MTDDTIPLFLNPAAGRGRAGRRIARIEQLFAERNIPITVVTSRAMSDLESRVTTHINDGARKIIVAGGDGSIHEAVNGMLRADKESSLGVIPTGTGNDFAKACDIMLDWEDATRVLADRLVANAATRKIDVGRMNDRYFANGAGIGFDAKVTRVARAFRWRIGDLVYLFAILRCLYDGVASPEIAISSDDFSLQGPLTLASVSNGPWVGGMFHIAPTASNADGNLDLLIVAPVSRLRVLALLPSLMRGRHMSEAEITHIIAQSVTVNSELPLESHLDGEVQPLQSRFEFSILPRALNLL